MIKTILPICLIYLDRRRKANCVIRSRTFFTPRYLLILGFVASGLQLPTVAHAQSFRIVDVGNGCKTIDLDDVEKPFRHVWSGGCSNGYTDGWGVLKRYKGNKLAAIGYGMHKQGSLVTDQVSETYYRPKIIAKNSSNLKDNIVQSKANPQQGTVEENVIPPSQVPEWAREIVDGRPRQSTPANLASQQSPQKSSSTAQGQSQNTSGESNTNRLAAVYNSQYFALPVVYTDDRMLRDVKRIYGEILEYNRADASVRADECPSGVTRGPYFGFVHYQNDSGQAAGMACSASSPDEAYRLAQEGCIKKGGRCSGGKHGKFIVIGDRRIAEGKASWAEKNNVVVFTRERTVSYEPGKKVYFTEKYNFSEGYVCHWQNGQMITNGPFTAEGTQPRGNYEFNCGSKY